MKRLLLMSVFVIFTLCSNAKASSVANFQNDKQQKSEKKQKKREKKIAEYELIKKVISKGDFVFNATSLTALKGFSKQLTTHYTVSFSDSLIKAYLPYFGEATFIVYGINGGVEFDMKPAEYTVEFNDKKLLVEVKFVIKERFDTYKGFLTVGGSGYSSLHINSNNRTPINYYGYVEEIRESESDKED